MKFQIIFTIVISLMFQVATAEDKAHSHHKTEKSELQLNAGKKWETDSPLRSGMEGIKSKIEAKLPEIHRNEFTKAQYEELSQKISMDLESIFKNCKLSPKADEQLHHILVQIIDGADKMKTSVKADERKNGVIKMIQSLDHYPKYFDHPNWKAIRH